MNKLHEQLAKAVCCPLGCAFPSNCAAHECQMEAAAVEAIMAKTAKCHRLAATRELEAEVERARRIIKGWADWHRMVEDDPKDDLPYLNGKAWDDAEVLACMCLTFLARDRQPEAARSPVDTGVIDTAQKLARRMGGEFIPTQQKGPEDE